MWPPFFFGAIPTYGVLPYAMIFKGYFSSLKIPIGLKENLREEDNLSTRDNWPVPKVSFVRRFYCIYDMHIQS